jgi:glycosyltransferase involved in cell wall biosynthesis
MTNRGIRVLVLTSLFPSRPGEKQGNFILDQVRELAAQGADVVVLVARPWIPSAFQSYANEDKRPVVAANYAAEPFQIKNASFFSLPRFALGRFAANFLRTLVPAIEFIDEQRPIDVIHAHGLQLGHVAVEAAARLRISSALTIHGEETAPRFDNSQAKREQIADTLERANKVILVGSPLLEYVRRYTPKVDHCVVIGNGFTNYPDLTPSILIPRSRPLRLIAVSNYEESKGFEILISAIDSLEPEYRSQIETVLVGAGDDFDLIGQQVERLGLADCVHYTGPLLHRDAMAEILATDVFCLPSWREAFGIMYAESMSLGKFTIGCKGQGPSDFIQHLQTGYLVEPRSSASVADALRWVLRNPEARKQIAERGREYALGNLTWSQNAARILNLYRSLITKNQTLDTRRESTASAAPKV